MRNTLIYLAEDEEEIDSKLLEVGHYFKPCELKQWVNWCDACGGVIVTMFGAALSCKSKCILSYSNFVSIFCCFKKSTETNDSHA